MIKNPLGNPADFLAYGFEEFDGVDVAGYGFGYSFGILHGVDYCGGAVGDVTSCEYPFASGHAVGVVAGEDVALTVYFDARGRVYDTGCRG